MKFGVIIVFLQILSNIYAKEITHFNDNVGSLRKNIFDSLNVNISVPFDNMDKIYLRILMDGIDSYSILERILPELTASTFPKVYLPCIAGGWKALRKSSIGKMLDAWGKPPERIFLVNLQWLGAYDECSSVGNAKYCLSQNVKLFNHLGISYGSCFPKQCTEADVVEILSLIGSYTKGLLTFDKSSTSTYCEEPTEYSTGVIITLLLLCAILLLCLIGTLFDIAISVDPSETSFLQNEMDKLRYHTNSVDHKNLESNAYNASNFPINTKQVSEGNIGEIEMRDLSQVLPVVENDASITSAPIANMEKALEFGLIRFFRCFSLLKNTKSILSTNVAEGSITSINGIRVISLTWIILGHFYMFNFLSAKPDNLLNVLNVIHRFSFLPVNNAYVSVDTFFLLSGLLVSYLTLKRIDKKGMGLMDIMMFYVHRYIRLTPSLLLVILFYTNIFPIVIKGPTGFTFSKTDLFLKPCYDSWWSTLIYINNFYPDNGGCVDWTWYLANDMQFYIISPGIILLMVFVEKRYSKGNKSIFYNFIIIMLLCTISIIITGIITGVYDIPALLTSAIILPGNPRRSQLEMIMNRLYQKPYCRITPYLVGIFLGYVLSRNIFLYGNGRKMKHLIGWLGSVATGLLVVYGPWHVYKDHGTFFNDAENITYSALNRFAWSCAVGWVIYACHNKVGGLVNTFLSWRAWIPLSRLTYGCYLLHILVVYFLTLSKETQAHYQDITAIFNVISVIVISYACSFVLAVCVEYPVFNLEKIIFNR